LEFFKNAKYYFEYTQMKIGFRADGSLDSGGGHITRCLTLAGIMARQGIQCIFISSKISNTLAQLILDQGFHLEILPLDNKEEILWNKYQAENLPPSENIRDFASSAANQIKDAEKTVSILFQHMINVVIVDHYGLDSTWHKIVNKNVRALVVIDDLGDRELLCDLLINPNDTPEVHTAYDFLSPESIKLLGSNFTIFREQIVKSRNDRLTLDESDIDRGKILVFLGGTDRKNLTKLVVEHLIAKNLQQRTTVILGATNPIKDNMLNWCSDNKVLASTNYNDVYNLMTFAPMAIVACGMTAVEMQFIGIKSILIPLSTIQTTVATTYQQAGRAIIITEDDLKSRDCFDKAFTAAMSIPTKSPPNSYSHSNGVDNILQTINKVLTKNGHR
jgi:UDP-2,4-diacetamido-2,4,6-trideoxy-beta-L-altropyranose hydrolase